MIFPDNEREPGAAAGTITDPLTTMLMRRLQRSFGIPPDDAAVMLSEARFALISNAEVAPDPEIFLAGLVREMACRYWQRSLPPDATEEEARAIRTIVFTGDALARLTPRAREALRLRYHAGSTYAGIAAELDVAEQYVRQMIARAVEKIRRAQRE